MTFEKINPSKKTKLKTYRRYCRRCKKLCTVTSKHSKICHLCLKRPNLQNDKKLTVYYHSLNMIIQYAKDNSRNINNFKFKEQNEGIKLIKYHVERIDKVMREL